MMKEPPLNSVVVDSAGVAWQSRINTPMKIVDRKVVLSGEPDFVAWSSTMGDDISWDSLQELEPLEVVYVPSWYGRSPVE